ncbi:hypothetical protein [Pseudanabaena sp. UWO310]|uniref:hypothetical protein n=1 Tax=Pseudanabaena sp. UWO310 TaxID=2480795 RepID=UPI00115A3EDE|nr:hypothetical protein [Pseudanabaena sp. UWO310]TYQ29970.1 hypothetical protein PseudUWO310_11155 [Pseudanabaena sp. UWO310]
MRPNFVDDTNWQLIYDNLTRAVYTSRNPDVYIPIPPISLSFSLPYRFLRVAANNQNAKATWRYGGYIDFLTDEISGAEVLRRSLACNKAVIIAVPDYLERYRITVAPPYWFDEISLQVDGYVGSL